MQHERNAVRKKCRLEIVIHENTTTEKKVQKLKMIKVQWQREILKKL